MTDRTTHLGLIGLALRLDICLVDVSELFNVGESVHAESVFRIEWVAVHLVQCEGSLVSVAEFYKRKPTGT